MHPQIDWQIDDDESEGEWRAPGAAGQRSPRPGQSRLGSRWALPVLLVLVLAGAAAAWLALRTRAHDDDLRGEVRRVAALEDSLLARDDVEALLALQDPSYPGWREWQRARGFTPRRVRGTLDPSPGIAQSPGTLAANYAAASAPEYGEVLLDGDRATLVVTRRYTSDTGGANPPATFGVRYEQYYVYTQGAWLRTGPPRTPASPSTFAGQYLTVLFPPGSADLIGPMAERLDQVAAQACADMHCFSASMRLVITDDTQELVRGRPGESAQTVVVPAPELGGRPQDAAGAEALYRLYATRVVQSMAARVAGRHVDSAGVWLHWEMAHLGLSAPLRAQDLLSAAQHGLREQISPPADPGSGEAGLWLALDFLAGPERRNPLRDLLAAPGAPALTAQLIHLTDLQATAWWQYLQRIASLDTAYPGHAQLALSCDGEATLWSATTGALRPLGASARSGLLWSPAGNRLVSRASITSFDVLDLAQGTSLRAGQIPLAWSPGGQDLVVESGDTHFMMRSILRMIPGGDSVVTSLAYGGGWTAWSPDGGHLAYATVEDQAKIMLADARGRDERAIAFGSRGAWSPDGRYLAVVDAGKLNTPVLLYDVQAGRLDTLLPATAGALYTMQWSADGAALALAMYEPSPSLRRGALVIVDRQGNLRHSWHLVGRPYDIAWLPGEDVLSFVTLPDRDEPGRLYLWNIEDDSVENALSFEWPHYTTFRWGWSSDGRWLAIDNGSVQVWSRDRSIVRTLAGCANPAWQPAGPG